MSMSVGFGSILLFKFIVQNLEGIGVYFSALEALSPAFILSLLSGYLVSKLWPDDELKDSYRADLRVGD